MTRLSLSILQAGFWIACLSVALVSLRFVTAPLTEVMAHMLHYANSVPLAFYAHVIGGPVALALAPFQLWQGLRRRKPQIHRVMGYIYVLAVVVAGLGSLVFLPQYLGTNLSALGFSLLAVAWISFTARGVWLARAGDHLAHRRFMARSLALTFAAVTLRVIMAPLIAQGWTIVETYQITAWACWLPNLIAVELWLQRKSKRAPE